MRQDIEQVLLPLDAASTLPARCYRSPKWFDQEREAIFESAWHYMCLGSTIRESGSYIVRQILGVSVIIARNPRGEARAFINTCRHRGSLVVPNDRGCVKAFVCSYHGWVYDLNGHALRSPGFDGNRPVPNGGSLIRLPLVERENMIFVNLDRDIESPSAHIDRYMGDYFSRIAAPHAVSSMRCVRTREYIVRANWKLYVEVDLETLHTPYVHAGSIGTQVVEAIGSDREWVGVFHRNRDTPALRPAERHFAFPPAKDAHQDGLAGTHFVVVLPGFFVVTAPDCMWWIQKTPISPDRTAVNVGYCFPEETLGRADYAVRAAHYFSRWDQVITEDDRIVEQHHAGLADGVQGCYSDEECVVHEFDKRVVFKILDRT